MNIFDYTVTVSNAFTRILNLEKRNQNIRDDILIMNGVAPSMTRQLDNEIAQKLANAETGEVILTETGEPVKTEVVKQKRGFGGGWKRPSFKPTTLKKNPVEE